MPAKVLEFTSMIVSSFLGKNQTSGADLPALIRTVHGALTNAAAPLPEPEPPQAPAVTARRSITPDALLCMECGKPFKSLKRHLRTDHGLSPEGYRSKWSLPNSYPMTAATYSAARSALAKSIGLGSRGRISAGETATAPAPVPKAHSPASAQTEASAAKPKRSRAAKPAAAK